jgi:hypothetical protein
MIIKSIYYPPALKEYYIISQKCIASSLDAENWNLPDTDIAGENTW